MPHIKKLPPSVVNQIAAGEVIERPASVVKELIENAIDADATRIDVTLEDGGMSLVRLADNGSGIASDELLLAVTSHATSKLETADDLFRVRTLGFRGEALASIAAVSHFRLRSRPPDAAAAAEIDVVGGQTADVRPCGSPLGTTVEVRNLFFNTPVRRKFLRTIQTELGHASEAFIRVALAHPTIHFTLQHKDRLLYDLAPVETWRERIVTFFGDELGEALLWVEGNDAQLKLSGYVANPNASRANNRMQYLFLNGRYIRDRSLQHALGEAYRGLLMTGRYPIAFLQLEMPPEDVDVNVHPTKLEVRFQDGGRIYSQLLGTIRGRFLSTDLTARVQPPAVGRDEALEPLVDSGANDLHRQALEDWARGGVAADHPLPRETQTEMQLARPVSEFRPFGGESPRIAPAQPADGAIRSETASSGKAPMAGERPRAIASPAGMQVHNRYLVTESDEGMVVIDQHALHERILYEELRQRIVDGKLETQRLLVPEPVSLAAAEVGAVLEARQTLLSLGLDIEPFGGDTVLISAYPAMLANLSPRELLRNVVDLLMAGGKLPERREMLDELLHMIACKAAVKAGDRLTQEEVQSLLEQRYLCQDAHHCPHGRPAALVFTREELDRRFKRV